MSKEGVPTRSNLVSRGIDEESPLADFATYLVPRNYPVRIVKVRAKATEYEAGTIGLVGVAVPCEIAFAEDAPARAQLDA